MAQWNTRLLTCRRWEVRTHLRQLLFRKKSCEGGEKNSPLKTANLTKIHCFHRKKMRAICGENFFSPPFTAILTLFFDQTSTRVVTQCGQFRSKVISSKRIRISSGLTSADQNFAKDMILGTTLLSIYDGCPIDLTPVSHQIFLLIRECWDVVWSILWVVISEQEWGGG